MAEPLQVMISKGEGIEVEFKTCRNQLNRDVYETVCAFLNRCGGTLLLGVKDDGTIQGIEPQALAQIRKDFVTAINNPQKISPPTYLSIKEEELDQKMLLHIYVPESSQVHRCNGRIYDRNEDGDLDITDHMTQVAKLYQRKQATYSENRVYPWVQPADLRSDLIEKCRKYLRINHENHPWSEMDDLELLTSARLLQTDQDTGNSGVTLAGIMLLGTDKQILQVCPAHRTDLILRKVDIDRYDDRDLVRTNLIESYDRILAFVKKHLSDPFYLEGIERRSLRDIIFREVASNMLIHREYASGASSRLIIEYGKVFTDNPNRPHGFGLLDPKTAVPFQKNPVIAAFFREIDRADELGSGMRKLMLYGKKYGGCDPQFIEGDMFKMVINVPEFDGSEKNSTTRQTNEQIPKGGAQSKRPSQKGPVDEAQSKKILQLLVKQTLSAKELCKHLGLQSKTGAFKRNIQELLNNNLIEYTVPDKPNSRLQKYCLTRQGRKTVENEKC